MTHPDTIRTQECSILARRLITFRYGLHGYHSEKLLDMAGKMGSKQDASGLTVVRTREAVGRARLDGGAEKREKGRYRRRDADPGTS